MTLTLNTDGLRLDAALAALLPELSRSAVQRLLEDGAVTLDGRPVRKNAKLPAGTVLNVEIPEAKPTENPAQDIPLDVVYEDDDVIVVNKPSGLVVPPAPGHPVRSGPASSTASTRTHPACSSPRKTTLRTRILLRSSRITALPGRMSASSAAICVRIPARSTRPSAATR